MTKLVVEIKNDRQIAVLKAILKFMGIAIVAERKVVEPSPADLRSFYQQFQIDLSDLNLTGSI